MGYINYLKETLYTYKSRTLVEGLKNDGYYISTGDKSVYYTLRQIVIIGRVAGYGPDGANIVNVENDYYVTKLSTDKDKALQKAKQITGFNLSADDIKVVPMSLKRDIDWSIFQSGKYNGRPVLEVVEENPDYIWFLYKQMRNATQYKKSIELAMDTPKMKQYVEELKSKGEQQKKDQEAKEQEWKDEKRKSKFVGEKGERIIINNINDLVVREFDGRDYYGNTIKKYITLFRDGDGNAFKFWGSISSKAKKIKATIKSHDLYEDEKQTTIQRPFIMEEY